MQSFGIAAEVKITLYIYWDKATLNVKNVPVRLGNVQTLHYRCHQKLA